MTIRCVIVLTCVYLLPYYFSPINNYSVYYTYVLLCTMLMKIYKLSVLLAKTYRRSNSCL